MPDFSLIAAYLAALRQNLQAKPRLRERILREAEEHLRDSAAQAEREGLSAEAAQRAAIARFGCAQVIARRFAGNATDQTSDASAGSGDAPGTVLRVLQGQERRATETLSRVGVRPLDEDLTRWDPADPGYRAAVLPALVAFELEAYVIGPEMEKGTPVAATAWMDDPCGGRFVAPQPMEWRRLVGTPSVNGKCRLFLAARTAFSMPGIYTIAVQLRGAEPVERGFRVRVEG